MKTSTLSTSNFKKCDILLKKVHLKNQQQTKITYPRMGSGGWKSPCRAKTPEPETNVDKKNEQTTNMRQ